MKHILMMIAICICLAACGGETETINSPEGGAVPVATGQPERGSSASFLATMSGAVDGTVEGTGALTGAKYGRYHINMASPRQPDGGPVVVIAFGRSDTSSPQPGTYRLDGADGFSGSVEIYGEPQRDFQITGGELVITEARGDLLSGTFSFTARESGEEYGEWEEIEVEGSFSSRAVS
jgi:hypothetical protein